MLTLILNLCLALGRPASAAGVNDALGWSAGPHTGQGTYLLVSDIHFDPFTDPAVAKNLDATPPTAWDSVFFQSKRTAFPDYTQDDNWLLWQSFLGAIGRTGVHYDYVLVMGDYLAHDFEKKYKATIGGGQKSYEDFVQKNLRYVEHSLSDHVAGVPIYFALGNNDSDCGDYALEPGGPFLSFLARDWNTVASSPSSARTFRRGGWYEAKLPGKAGRLIALNDIFWSRRFSPKCSDPDRDPAKEELDWLKVRLEAAEKAGEKVTLTGHIPPGVNGFRAQCGLPPESYLKPEDQAPLLDLLRRHAASLRLVFMGHTHFDDFKVLSDQGAPAVGIHLVPSVGPNHGNNPSFQVGLYRRADGGLLDLATYSLRNLTTTTRGGVKPDWALEYGFKQAYGRDFGLAGLAAAAQEIRAGGDARSLYEAYYTCRTPSPAALKSEEWIFYSCAQTCFTPEEYAACACGKAP